MAGRGKHRIGVLSEPAREQASNCARAERLGREVPRRRVAGQPGEQVGGVALPAAGGDQHRDRQLLKPRLHKGEEPQRWRISPVRIVN